jgi:conjugal transfer pilus assembly protein TrbC
MLQWLCGLADSESMKRRIVVIGLVVAGIAQAQNQRMPTQSDVAKQRIPAASAVQDELARQRARAEQTNQTLSEAAKRARLQANPETVANGLPKVTMPQVPGYGGRPPDPQTLANQYTEALAQASKEQTHNIVVFASLSIPEEALRRIGRDVKRAGGVVVIRGLKYGLQPGSWKRSLEALKPLAETGVDVQINPNLFQQFGVRQVPTFVVSADGVGDKGCSSGECVAIVGTVVGDVTLEYALEVLADRKDVVGRIARQKVGLLK